jgi:hypothetical protein
LGVFFYVVPYKVALLRVFGVAPASDHGDNTLVPHGIDHVLSIGFTNNTQMPLRALFY